MISTIYSSIDPDRVRRRKRGLVTEQTYKDLKIVVCPSWDEVAELEGQGVLPIHIDELEILHASTFLDPIDIDFILSLRMQHQGIRLTGTLENTKNGSRRKES